METIAANPGGAGEGDDVGLPRLSADDRATIDTDQVLIRAVDVAGDRFLVVFDRLQDTGSGYKNVNSRERTVATAGNFVVEVPESDGGTAFEIIGSWVTPRDVMDPSDAEMIVALTYTADGLIQSAAPAGG